MRSVLDMRLGTLNAPVDMEALCAMHSHGGDTGCAHGMGEPPCHLDNAGHDRRPVDLFGIPIVRPDGEVASDGFERFCEPFDAPFPAAAESDGACSVLLAESPSRLDLSALLC